MSMNRRSLFASLASLAIAGKVSETHADVPTERIVAWCSPQITCVLHMRMLKDADLKTNPFQWDTQVEIDLTIKSGLVSQPITRTRTMTEWRLGDTVTCRCWTDEILALCHV